MGSVMFIFPFASTSPRAGMKSTVAVSDPFATGGAKDPHSMVVITSTGGFPRHAENVSGEAPGVLAWYTKRAISYRP